MMKKILPYVGPWIAAIAGLIQLCLLFYIFVERIGYPLDLEWEEGGMLCHALRIFEGKPIYGPPSVDFISFFYTPFHPFVLATLGKVFGLSYILGRLVSIVSFLITILLIVDAVRRQVGQKWIGIGWGIAVAGLIASSFQYVAGWYDLVRIDSLYMGLVTGGLYLLVYYRNKTSGVVFAGILMGLAFLTKQTASIFIVYSGLALLFLNWRKLPLYMLVVGIVAGGTVLFLNHSSDGWFWKYIFQMHQANAFSADLAWHKTPLTLMRSFPVPAAIIGLWGVLSCLQWIKTKRIPDGNNIYWFVVVFVGAMVSSIGYGTLWAAENAFIPGFVFSAAFVGIACGDLSRVDSSVGNEKTFSWQSKHAPAFSLLLGSALAAQMIMQLYSPSKHLPSTHDWEISTKFLDRMSKMKEPILIPSHPWYLHIIGKPTHYHLMGTMDIFPNDLVQKISKKEYGTIILNNEPPVTYNFVALYYKLLHRFSEDEVAKVVEAYKVRPTYILVPKQPDPVPLGAKRIFDFEDGTYNGWEHSRSAFGPRPIGGEKGPQIMAGPYEGSYLAASFFPSSQLTGTLRSPEFVVDRPILTYRIGGGRDIDHLFVRLLVDDQEVYRGTGNNSHEMQEVQVDVSAYVGKHMRIELVDENRGPWGHLLFDDVQLRPKNLN